jgi:HEAT repeat protein
MNAAKENTGEIPTLELIEDLGEVSYHDRHQARLALVDRGEETIPALIEALTSPNRHIRWGAVQVLGEIQVPDTAPILVEMLKDDDPGVRWAARDSLIRMGRISLYPLLQKYIQDFSSVLIRQGTQHILRELAECHDLDDDQIQELDELISENLVDSASASKLLSKARKVLDRLEEQEIYE